MTSVSTLSERIDSELSAANSTLYFGVPMHF
jgi:hypothetical protein